MSSANARLALVLGATGAIGGATASALIAHGWRVRALTRDLRAARLRGLDPALEWAQGDAMDSAAACDAATGADVIFHGVNPPGYRRWRELAIPMLANTIRAAQATGARILFPGNVYNFGPDAWPLLSETSPQHPQTRKGAVRVQMETMLQDATNQGVRSLVVRAGDFFGGRPRDSWLASVILKGGAQATKIVYPGETKAGHAWAYIPDLAETFARLADIERELAAFEVLHFGGHWIEPGIALAEILRQVLGRPDLPIGRFPWWGIRLGAPFSQFFREVLEMRYLWNEAVRLDNARLVRTLGAEPHTPLEKALGDTVFGSVRDAK